MDTVGFEIADIESFRVYVFFDKIELETLHSKLKSIERGRFISGRIKSDSFIQFVEEKIPSLQLTGNGFRIEVYSNSITLEVASEPMKGMFRMSPPHAYDPPEKLFAKDNFQKLNVDFNAVVGQVLGTLGLDYAATKFMVKIDLRKNGADYQTNRFSEKINPVIQSLLGESIKIQSTSIVFKTKETFLGTSVDAHYNLHRKRSLVDDKINAIVLSGMFSFKNTGIQDLNMILEEYLKRINDVVKKLVGGLNVNERI